MKNHFPRDLSRRFEQAAAGESDRDALGLALGVETFMPLRERRA